jgi:FkbH-like protein
LKRKHLSSYRINWLDKAKNIDDLSVELNLNADSFVFIDDNPVECEFVKSLLPDVTVLQVPEKLYYLPEILFEDGLFDTLTLSEEDKIRTLLYQGEALRKKEKEKFSNLDEYLSSLQIEIIIHRAKPEEISRIAQLTQKTNQFNFTTKRYSEEQIKSFIENQDGYHVYSLAARDKFGDMGLTGLLIFKREDDNTAYIDTFLLSCRILGRKIEISFLNYCISRSEESWDIKRWKAEYIPTKKNQQIEKFWDQAGFDKISEGQSSVIYIIDKEKRINTSISFIKIS